MLNQKELQDLKAFASEAARLIRRLLRGDGDIGDHVADIELLAQASCSNTVSRPLWRETGRTDTLRRFISCLTWRLMGLGRALSIFIAARAP